MGFTCAMQNVLLENKVDEFYLDTLEWLQIAIAPEWECRLTPLAVLLMQLPLLNEDMSCRPLCIVALKSRSSTLSTCGNEAIDTWIKHKLLGFSLYQTRIRPAAKPKKGKAADFYRIFAQPRWHHSLELWIWWHLLHQLSEFVEEAKVWQAPMETFSVYGRNLNQAIVMMKM